jgi:diadenosine tetraphosphate (Ap4A) HIT family hydrolase
MEGSHTVVNVFMGPTAFMTFHLGPLAVSSLAIHLIPGISPYEMNPSAGCPFCLIAATYTPSEPYIPSDPDSTLIAPNCHLILNTKTVMAFLDIMPITMGHVLVVPRVHREKIGDLQGEEGAALGQWLPSISRAVMRALGKDLPSGGDYNVVQNNGKIVLTMQVFPNIETV